MPVLELKVTGKSPVSLKEFLRREAGLSTHTISRLKTVPDGITRNGVQIRVTASVYAGETIRLHYPEHPSEEPNPALCVPVVYETAHIVVCNKPVGMPVHTSILHRDDTLANWFAAHCPDAGFHLLGRLDRNTSGLCAVAKSAYAANILEGKIQKSYVALVPPGLTGSGTVDAPIARVEESVILRCVREDGRRAVTHYEVIRNTPACTLVRFRLETGRTHQIRVHMAHIGFPLLGDSLYAGDCSRLPTHALHCDTMHLPDPETGEPLTLYAPMREDMRRVLEETP